MGSGGVRSPRRVALDFLRRYYGLEEMHRQMAWIPLPLEPEDDDEDVCLA